GRVERSQEAVVVLDAFTAERRRLADPRQVVARAGDEVVEPALGEHRDARRRGDGEAFDHHVPGAPTANCSTSRTLPVISALSSEAENAAACAMSRGDRMRPNARVLPASSAQWAGWPSSSRLTRSSPSVRV